MKPWFITYSGGKYFLTEPRLRDIHIVDIAHALALINRFGGHTQVPYSVGQHSMYVVKMLQLMTKDPLVHLHGLLHDASEFVLGDVVRPLKHSMPQYLALEAKTQALILRKLGVSDLKLAEELLVKTADNRVLLAERREIIKLCPHRWAYLNEKPAPFKIEPENWRRTEQRFLSEFHSLKAKI